MMLQQRFFFGSIRMSDPSQDRRNRKGSAGTCLLTLVFSGAGEKSRTPDLRITNALLYQLSYAGMAS